MDFDLSENGSSETTYDKEIKTWLGYETVSAITAMKLYNY